MTELWHSLLHFLWMYWKGILLIFMRTLPYEADATYVSTNREAKLSFISEMERRMSGEPFQNLQHPKHTSESPQIKSFDGI
jgi:hypothetical protein